MSDKQLDNTPTQDNTQADQINADPQLRPGDVTQEAQKELARPDQTVEKLPQEDNDVPNPVPANPTSEKDKAAISDSTPGLAQAVTTLNPRARRQEGNFANDLEGDHPDNEVNINGVNVQDTPARLANDPNFAKQYQELAQDEKNNPIVNGGKVPKLNLKKIKYNDEDITTDEPAEEKEAPKNFDKDQLRKSDESQAEYNERVPVAEQPVVDGNEYDYLGRKKD